MPSSAVTVIPRFLLPGGISASTLHFVGEFSSLRSTIGFERRTTAPPTRHDISINAALYGRRRFLSTFPSLLNSSPKSMKPSADYKQRVLAKPDKFRPPSHPQRKVLRQRRDGTVIDSTEPHNYPGPPLSAEEKEAQKTRRYPNMFPPEGTVMFKFLTSRWIHVWIAMGVLFSCASFVFVTEFKRTSPFAHLLPAWSGFLTSPIDTISQVLSVYRMHVEHNSMLTRERRHQRIQDAEKRRRYRVAHGLETPDEEGLVVSDSSKDSQVDDDQSPIAADILQDNRVANKVASAAREDYVGIEGRGKPIKKWLGIW